MTSKPSHRLLDAPATSTITGQDKTGHEEEEEDDDDGHGEEVPPFYIYKLPIVRLSGCYW